MEISSAKYVNPFSQNAIEFSARFDFATIHKDTTELQKLLNEAESILDEEDSASQAMLCYSLGTAYDDLARITGSRTEQSFQKVLYYFRKSISLIEQDEYADEKYSPYVISLKEILYTNYANALDHCGRKIAAIEQYKKCYRFIAILEWLLGI